MSAINSNDLLAYKEVADAATRDAKIQLPKLELGPDVSPERFVESVRKQLAIMQRTAAGAALRAIQSYLDLFSILDLSTGIGAVGLDVPHTIGAAKAASARKRSMPAAPTRARNLLPPELVGLTLSYVEDKAQEKALSPMVRALTGISSPEAEMTAEMTAQKALDSINQKHQAAGRAVLHALNQIMAGQEAELDRTRFPNLVDVYDIEGLHDVLQKCESPEVFGRLLRFLTANCPNLRQLDLSRIAILTPEHLRSLSALPFLHTLSLAGAHIDDTHITALKDLQLEKCDISDTRITGSSLQDLPRSIKELSVHHCRALTDEGVAGLGERRAADGTVVHAAMQLTHCNLAGTPITGRSLHTLNRGVQNLNLRNCQRLTDEGVTGLGERRAADGALLLAAMQLTRCDLGGTPITGSTLYALNRGMRDISLEGCQRLTDAGVTGLTEKRAADGTLVHAAMQLTRCVLPQQISPDLRARFPVEND